MKSNVTYIPREELVDVARRAGCIVSEQAGFYKVSKEGAHGVFYVSKTPQCGRIDISRVSIEGHDDKVVNLGGEKFGRVKQQVDFGGEGRPQKTKEEILEFFRWMCENISSLKEVPRARNTFRGRQRQQVEVQPVQVTIQESPEQQITNLLAHKRRLEETATRYNTIVSKKTMTTLLEKLSKLGYNGPELR